MEELRNINYITEETNSKMAKVNLPLSIIILSTNGKKIWQNVFFLNDPTVCCL